MRPITIENLLAIKAAMKLQDGVRIEVYPTDKNHEFIIALYDQRTPQRAVQGSWQCKEQEAVQRLNEINRRYGKEV